MTKTTDFNYDVIVIGGGHAGCEAASAAANMGARTCLVTMDMNKIAQMRRNPAVGGIAKGQIVREIDAMGGQMAMVTDRTAIQFRMLNKGKGPAVWSPRAQCDRGKFIWEWRHTLDHTPNLDIWQDQASEPSRGERRGRGHHHNLGGNLQSQGRGHHSGYLPQRSHAYRTSQSAGWQMRRTCFLSSYREHHAMGCQGWQNENGHTGAAGQAYHSFRRYGRTAGGHRFPSVQLHGGAACPKAATLLDVRDQRKGARNSTQRPGQFPTLQRPDTKHGTAVLSVDRDQGS